MPRPPLVQNRVLVPTVTISDIIQAAGALATSVDYVNVRRLRTVPCRTAVMSASKFMYSMLEAYYAADGRRRRSEEDDYGVYWRLHGGSTFGGCPTSAAPVRSTPSIRVP